MQRIYLDHNATSPIAELARSALVRCLHEGFANPGSVHAEGQSARALLARARRAMRKALALEGGHVIFTSGATEANNLLLRGLDDDGTIVCSRLEHASIRGVVEVLEASGRPVRWLRSDERGRVDLEQLELFLSSERVALVCAMAANNELGNISPLPEIGALCDHHGVRLHVDAAQTFGRFDLPLPPGVWSVTASAHKAGGPLGAGFLWVRERELLTAQLVGGGQERGWRAGTPNLPALAGWAAVVNGGWTARWDGLGPVRDAIEAGLAERFDVAFHGDARARLPNTSCLSLVGRDAEEVVMALDLAGIAVSAGSACTAGSIDPSPVMQVLGLPDAHVKSAIRISLGPGQQDLDVGALLARFVDALGTMGD